MEQLVGERNLLLHLAFDAFDSNNDYIGIELNIPIFSGGNTYYSTKQAAYLEEKTRYELLKKKREVVRDTRQAFLNLKSSISKVKYSCT